jgi:hypothetical protein
MEVPSLAGLPHCTVQLPLSRLNRAQKESALQLDLLIGLLDEDRSLGGRPL